MLHELIGLA